MKSIPSSGDCHGPGRPPDRAPALFLSQARPGGGPAQTFWYAMRKPAEHSKGDIDHGTEIYLSLVDLNFEPSAPADWTLEVETTCLNRDLPDRLPFGGDQPRLQLSQGSGLVSRIACLTPPTRTLRPASGKGAVTTDLPPVPQSSVLGGQRRRPLTPTPLPAAGERGWGEGRAKHSRGPQALRLHRRRGNTQMIDGILGVTSKRVVAQCRRRRLLPRSGGHAGFDEEHVSGSGLFLFASVLERFLALYCTVNSFTRLVATVQGRDGELCRWQPHGRKCWSERQAVPRAVCL